MIPGDVKGEAPEWGWKHNALALFRVPSDRFALAAVFLVGLSGGFAMSYVANPPLTNGWRSTAAGLQRGADPTYKLEN